MVCGNLSNLQRNENDNDRAFAIYREAFSCQLDVMKVAQIDQQAMLPHPWPQCGISSISSDGR